MLAVGHPVQIVAGKILMLGLRRRNSSKESPDSSVCLRTDHLGSVPSVFWTIFTKDQQTEAEDVYYLPYRIVYPLA